MKYDVEIELELEDILEYIYNDAPDSEIEKIKDAIHYDANEGAGEYCFPVDNLYDRERFLILKEAMKRYSLDVLIEKLGITEADAL